MLIECPECNKEVSDLAMACPNCGLRIQKVQTIEKTGKGLKLAQLLGVITFTIGGFAYFGVWGGFLVGTTYIQYSRPLLVFGGVLFIIARALAWWRHG